MEVFDGGITSPKGFKAAGVHCGIKKEKLDLAVIYSEVPAKCAIAYTQNKVRAAPIEVMMKKDPKTLQALVINSGNANAITGVQGIYDSKQMVFLTAQTLGIRDTLVGVASTGNELVSPGEPLAAGQIYDINTYTIAAAVADCGAQACTTASCPMKSRP